MTIGLGYWTCGCVGLGLGCSSGYLVATLVVWFPWVRSKTLLVLGTQKYQVIGQMRLLATGWKWACSSGGAFGTLGANECILGFSHRSCTN